MNVDVLDTVGFGGFDERVDVGNVRVNASVRDQTAEVDSGSVFLGVLERSDDVGLSSEFLLLDTCVSAEQRAHDGVS